VVLVPLFTCIAAVLCIGNKQCMSMERYDVIIRLLKGDFHVPVQKRTKEQRAALVQFWRYKDRLHLDDDGKKLLLDGREVCRVDSMDKVVDIGLKASKGSGARRLNLRLHSNYIGVSRKRIQRILDRSKRYRQMKAKFTNKAMFRPITAKKVHDRNQIDLIDMTKWVVQYKGIAYKYILTIIDVFSRFVWLRALDNKSSARVAQELMSIYSEHGVPMILQHDRGTEFSGAVKKLMDKLQVKIIRSSSYHPESQGKVERCHRTLRSKLSYDLIHFKNKGINWVKQLPIYAAALNEDSKEELQWKSPFQIYYGRQSNRIVNPIDVSPAEIRSEIIASNLSDFQPSFDDIVAFDRCRNNLRRGAKKSGKRCMAHMVRRGMKKNPASVYKLNEIVLVRYTNKGHKVPKRHRVIKGKIVKRNLMFSSYKITLKPPDCSYPITKWFSVSDITSTSRKKELSRKITPEQMNKKHKYTAHKRKFYIVYSHNERLSNFQSEGLTVQFDPLPDGNYQFEALADQLLQVGVHRSGDTLRREIVQDLRNHPIALDLSPIDAFVAENDLESYLASMMNTGTYGDHITLQRAAQMFCVNILVFSSLGPHATALLSPSPDFNPELPTLVLGHIAEGHGEHYVSLSISNEMVRNTLDRLGFDQGNNGSVLNNDDSMYPFSTPSSTPPTNELVIADDTETMETLPNEILSEIIRWCMHDDCHMLGSFNRVSNEFKTLTKAFLPQIHLNDSLVQRLGLHSVLENFVSVRKLIRIAGKRSGLALRIRQLFSLNRRWYSAWLIISALNFGNFVINDIFWK